MRAWSPPVDGITEVLHASFTDHAYPMHLHDTWALLVIDDGAVRYALDRQEHGAVERGVTLLPPYVAHNGRAATPQGFRKRVLYLDPAQFDDRLIGRAVDRPTVVDAPLRQRIDQLHSLLAGTGDELAAELHLAFVTERLRAHLRRMPPEPATAHDPRIAGQLRDLLDERFVEGVTLREASLTLHVNPTYLVRVFSREFGIGPHQYVISRRVDLARRLLRDGLPVREVAVAAGFYDQAHLSRHFKRILGFNPGQYGPHGRRRAAAPAGPGRAEPAGTGPVPVGSAGSARTGPVPVGSAR